MTVAVRRSRRRSRIYGIPFNLGIGESFEVYSNTVLKVWKAFLTSQSCIDRYDFILSISSGPMCKTYRHLLELMLLRAPDNIGNFYQKSSFTIYRWQMHAGSRSLPAGCSV